ncbi:hypothetical protein MNBD_ACTINO01-2279, partial [hydrothermal vent metagenome]
GERDTLDAGPVRWTPQTPEPGMDLKSPYPHIEMTPYRIDGPFVVTGTS